MLSAHVDDGKLKVAIERCCRNALPHEKFMRTLAEAALIWIKACPSSDSGDQLTQTKAA
jgi:hypothetical protein